ncbi:hypothetical protein GN958_ATG13963, partial [Phytophthora infestans]
MPRVRFPDGAFSYATILFYLFYCVGRIFRRIQCVVDIKFNPLCYRSLANHANFSSCVEGRFWELSLVSRTAADASMAVGIGGQLLIDRMECAMRSVAGDVGDIKSNALCYRSLANHANCSSCVEGRFWKLSLVSRTTADASMAVGIGGQLLIDSDGVCDAQCRWRWLVCVVDIKFNALCYRSLANHANCLSCVEGWFWELSLVSRTTADAS